MNIYELPNPKPYFEPIGGHCSLHVTDRTHLSTDCGAPATLIRRELFFPGWGADINGAAAKISEYGDIFQAIQLPKGKSEVRFRYAPPYRLGLAFNVGSVAVLLAGPLGWREKYRQVIATLRGG